jgi:hypothetical protein
MKNILLSIINNDNSYNKSATRYLYKTHPELWQHVVEKTSFLPSTALAKQRVWHITNDMWEIPTCPITGTQVKWWENRYLKTSNRTAKTQLQHKRGDFVNLYSDEINQKRASSNKRTFAAGLRKKPTLTEEIKRLRVEKSKQTCLERYGVSNGGKTPNARKKVSEKRISNGATPMHLRSLRRLYYDAVWQATEESWKSQFDKINPNRLNRSKNALDHIYSIQQGFRDNIPPYVIGHWSNLRVISLSENSQKGMRCDKTKEQLFEDFDTLL